MSAILFEKSPKNSTPFSRSNRSTAVLHHGQSYSLQAEQAVIGALLESPETVYDEIAGKLQADQFFNPFCKLAFSKMVELIQDGNSPDSVMLAASMDGYVELDTDQIEAELADINNRYPGIKNVKGWAKIIVDKFLQRQIEKTGDRLKEIAHAQDFDSEEKISQANKLLHEASLALTNDTVATTEELVFHAIKQIQERENLGEEVAGKSYGFPELDAVTTGMHGSELIVIAARPSMGKTAFALAIGKANAAHSDLNRRVGVLFFTLEMSPEQMGLRWLSAVYDVTQQNMRSGRVSSEEWEKLNLAMSESKDYPFYVDKNSSVTADQISAIARKEHRERGLGLVIVDYLQLVSDSGQKNSNRAETVSDISRSLKNLSRELGIPVIALSQLNRSVEQRPDKRPMMSDLRESGSIEQDADVIMFIYRDDYYNKLNSKKPGIAEIIIAKQRNGPTLTVDLDWHGPTTKFKSRLAKTAPECDRSTSFTQGINDAFSAIDAPF